MLIAMEITLAREKSGWVWGGHMLGCVGGDIGDMGSLPPGLGISATGLGELEAGEGMEGKEGVLATRVRGEGTLAGLGEPGAPG